ncbi:MAG: wax ester/triacylglycerol synthase family O-acyltransferase [Acidimicrobiales bacterium]
MRRLAGSDAGFLFVESPTQSSTCIDIAELGPAADGRGPLALPELRHHLDARLHLVPHLRWRLETVPLEIAHPVWVRDADFDLDYHVRELTVDAPGAPADLDRLIAEHCTAPLDRRHPLWQVVLVHGLAGGRQALVFRFHHSVADGAGLITTIEELFSERPVPPAPPFRGESPSRLQVFLVALLHQLRAWLAAPRLLRTTLRRFRETDARRESAPVPVPRPMGDAPPSRLNRSDDAVRTFARARLSLADVQAVKNAAGTTMSDVVLAMVAGALRRSLLMSDELPETPLVVNVPLGTDPPDAPRRTSGNVFANFFAYLATDVEDPRQRLEAIAANTAESKVQLDVLGIDTLPSWLDRFPPAIAGPVARRMARRLREGDHNPDFNVLVSNVRIPGEPRSIGTRPFSRFSMSGPVADGAGLNITVAGCAPHLEVAITANPAAVPDPHELGALLKGALAELLKAYDLTPRSVEAAAAGSRA